MPTDISRLFSPFNQIATNAGRLGQKASDFGARSLLAGFLTSAARRGASVFTMRECPGTNRWSCCNPTCATPTCKQEHVV